MEIISEIVYQLNTFAQPEKLAYYLRIVPTKLKILAVTAQNQKCVLKELRTLTIHCSPQEKINLAIELVNLGIFETRQIAYEYLGKDKLVLPEITKSTCIIVLKLR